MNDLLKRLGIEHPIIAAPMAGGPSTPELAAAVSNAGGMGSLGAAYLTPAEIATLMDQARKLTSRPFNLNLFAGGYGLSAKGNGHHVDPQPMLAIMTEIYRQFGLPAPELPPLPACPFQEQLEAVLAAKPAVFSFTFGVASKEAIAKLHAAGIVVLGTATTVEEAWMLIEAGVDGIVAQGAEAGAHRGTFLSSFEASMVPTLQLVREISAISNTPVIASGGIMDGADIARALAAGASAVQMGTAFLPCPESGASAVYKQALLAARADTTMVTRAFSGRPARGLKNDFMRKFVGRDEIILPFPQQNSLTKPMRKAAGQQGDTQFLSLWAGTGVARSRSLPAAELVRALVEEMRQFDSTKK
jgi:nitronate monooxygenase